jgi:ubiquinol-cytochrome c reductase cytochrome b subunit
MTLLTRAWRWFDDRTGLGGLVRQAAHKPIPPGVASVRHGWWYVFGIATLAAFLNQVMTGIALATMYIPSTESAYDSLQYITESATFGRVLRGMHYFGASAMVVLIVMHMARVFLTGSYKFPRELNWLSGVILLGLVLAMAFTGQLLRWDRDAVASVHIAVYQVGRLPIVGEAIARFILAGQTIGATTLSRFFAYHVFFLPAIMLLVLGFHLYLVVRNGVSEPPAGGRPVDPRTYRAWYAALLERHGRPYVPDAAWREAIAGVGLIAVIALLALFVGPRALAAPPDPTITDATPKPDWYFLPYYALITVVPSAFERSVVLLTVGVVGGALLLLPLVANRGERSPARRPWAVGTVCLAAIVLAALLVTGVKSPWIPAFDTEPITADTLGVDSGPAVTGAQLFYTKGCQFCHAVEGRGGSYGPDLTYVFRRYRVEQLTIIILRGRENMPAYRGALTDDELEAIIAFLTTTGTRGQ